MTDILEIMEAFADLGQASEKLVAGLRLELINDDEFESKFREEVDKFVDRVRPSEESPDTTEQGSG